MTSHYQNSIPVVIYLLFCLFVASVSAHSFIRQATDGININQQEESEAGPVQDVDKAHYVPKYQEISSRDYKVSASNAVKGLRDRPPSSYSLKMESFNTLLQSSDTERYESRPFTVGAYNWTLVVYPNGNKKDNGSGYLSLYVAIDNSTLLASQQEVYVDLRFYVFNKKERKYFSIQDIDVWKFDSFKTMWGFSQVLSVDTFKDPSNGYLYDGDHCEFGVDVIIPSRFEKSELFTITENFNDAKFTWGIRGFSTLVKDSYVSDVFSVGGRKWNVKVYPNGDSEVEGKNLSMFLMSDEKEKRKPYEKIYVRAMLRVLNQRQFSNSEKKLEAWYDYPGQSWGYARVISLSDLKDSTKGFVVNDVLMVQAEIQAISSTKYFNN